MDKSIGGRSASCTVGIKAIGGCSTSNTQRTRFFKYSARAWLGISDAGNFKPLKERDPGNFASPITSPL